MSRLAKAAVAGRLTHLPSPLERPWLTVAELAQITGEGEKAIRVAIAAGTLPHIMVGRYVRIPTAELHRTLGIDPAGAGPASHGPGATVHPIDHPGLTA